MAVQWLKFWTCNAGDTGSTPGQGTKTLPATWCGQRKKCGWRIECCRLKITENSLSLPSWKCAVCFSTLWNPNSITESVAVAKSHQSCPTLCDPIDGSPPGSCPWDSPGKNTGVGCHFLLQCMKVKSESEVAQSSPTLSDPMD